MKRAILNLSSLILAFLLGVATNTVWEYRAQIDDFLTNIFLYYQD